MILLAGLTRRELYERVRLVSSLKRKIASANRYGPCLSEPDLKFLQELLSAYGESAEKRLSTRSEKLAVPVKNPADGRVATFGQRYHAR